MPIKVFLTVTDGPSKGLNIDFTQGRVVLGRAKSDLILADKKVSSQHCSIRIEGDQAILDDLKSTNGTFVGGSRIEEGYVLQNMDEVIIGLSKISVAIVEQISEFKKANSPQKAPATEEVVEVSQAATRQATVPMTEIPDPDAPYRTTGIHRIENLIKDEMNTFSKWDHPGVPDASEPKVSMIPRLQVRLIKKKGPDPFTELLCQKPQTVLGRKNCDYKLSDLDCSRHHLQIEIIGDSKVMARDLGSTNGSFVNGARISAQELRNGDIIQIGQTVLETKIEKPEK